MATLVSTVVGRVLEAGIAVLRSVRGTRPMHPHGVTVTGTLTPRAGRTPSGLAWLDELEDARPVAITGRISRGVGLPAAFPDIQGLALRVPTPNAGLVDILTSSSGLGMPGRFGLTLRRSIAGARLSTIMPYRGANGPVLLMLIADAEPQLPGDLGALARTVTSTPLRLRLLHASPRGRWRLVGHVELRHDPAAAVDSDTRYDAVLSAPAENTYAWTRRAREPGYRLSRAGRRVASADER